MAKYTVTRGGLEDEVTRVDSYTIDANGILRLLDIRGKELIVYRNWDSFRKGGISATESE